MRRLMALAVVMLGCGDPELTRVCDPSFDRATFVRECIAAGSAVATVDDDADYLVMQCRATVGNVCPEVWGVRIGPWAGSPRVACSELPRAALPEYRKLCEGVGK